MSIALHDIRHGMRRHLQNVTLPRHLALLDVANLLPNRHQRVDEPVELLLAFALRGLDHECVGDGPAHGRGVETEILETLGDVDSLDAGGFLEGPGVEDELVSAAAVLVGVKDLVMGL